MCDADRIDVSTLSEPELIALRDLLDQLIPVAAAAERAGGGRISRCPSPAARRRPSSPFQPRFNHDA